MVHSFQVGLNFSFIEQVQYLFQKIEAPVKFDVLDDFSRDRSGIDKLKNYSTILRGPRAHEMSKGRLHVSQELEMFAYIVHAKSIPGIKTRHGDLDIVTI